MAGDRQKAAAQVEKERKKAALLSSKGSFVSQLQFYYVLSLWSAVAFYHVEFNALAFFKSFEAFASDCAEVNEYVVSAFNCDETITFFSVEPFYCTCLHGCYLQQS